MYTLFESDTQYEDEDKGAYSAFAQFLRPSGNTCQFGCVPHALTGISPTHNPILLHSILLIDRHKTKIYKGTEVQIHTFNLTNRWRWVVSFMVQLLYF